MDWLTGQISEGPAGLNFIFELYITYVERFTLQVQ